MVRVLRPGLKPPCAQRMGTVVLKKVYDRERALWAKELADSWISMSVDGWTGPTGGPVLGICVADQLFSVQETFGEQHTADLGWRAAEGVLHAGSITCHGLSEQHGCHPSPPTGAVS